MTKRLIAKNVVPHLSNLKWCLFSFNNQILKYIYDEERFEKLTYISPEGSKLKEFVKEKILRNYFYKRFISRAFGINHISANKNFVIALYSGLYYHRLDEPYRKAKRCEKYDNIRVSGPLFQGIAVHEQSQHFYFGEYICSKKSEIKIVRISKDLQEVDVVYRFKDHPIQHVHGVFYDQFLNRLWVTTGDNNEECGIFYTDDEFLTVHKLGGGDQSWRAVSLIPMEDRLVWGSDAGKDARKEDVNMIYSYRYSTGEKTADVCIGNPAYHSIIDEYDNIYIGVNYEPGRKQDTKEKMAIWRYDGHRWTKLQDFKYLKGRVQGSSRYGYIYFPKGVAPYNHVPFLVLNSAELSFATYMLDLA
jgi:hypothetical protein